MSFGEKIASIMQRPGQDPVAKDDVPWWMKYAARGLGTVGGFIAIFLGVWNCASILFASIICFLSGIWQMLAGFIVLMIEAPCCCMFIDFVQNLSDMVESKPYWNRAAAYCLLALPPVFLCPKIESILGSGFIFATGIIYGLMSVGRKAPWGEMRSTAMETQAPSSSMQSTLVENAQPMGYSSKPDSNV
ncbi:calcium channel flower-like isoform X1 [Vespa mandarinia]|uniref:calcium channel flower-like isoform X1 n=1 Tax=Vespa mandarinia TaxID=7446 RepID=UPI0016162041|nr:calcium channel flower-like isoform X1 [Vespa mandarinia]XP_046818076.1 calcium channel flower isoform X1 [Vespa crabro]XP_047351417.1 calcium channel flower isoform X1 [Vespa velutina]